MSGSSLEYVYGKVDDAVDKIREYSKEPLHLAFADHLVKVSKALHDLEWLFSGDYSPGRETESLLEVISHEDAIRAGVSQALDAAEVLTKTIRMAQTALEPKR